MRTYDFSPLLRSAVGFDRMAQMMDSLPRGEDTGYPPYNIEKLGEDAYRITMAVAGFGEDELEVSTKDTTLLVAGQAKEAEGQTTFLHRGIARRAFERRFALAEHIKINGAHLENGLLHVDLVREVPEAKKPRTIEIQRGAPEQPKVIETQAA